MKLVYINYADENFEENQNFLLHHISKNNIFPEAKAYSRKWLESTKFYSENKKILDYQRLSGYALWKPYIILQSLESSDLAYGDAVVYMDCGDIPLAPQLNSCIEEYLLKEDQYFINTVTLQNKQYTKRDCFVLMGCDEEKYWNDIQLEDGFLVFKKTDFNIEFVKEWLEYCKDERVITDCENVCGLPNFPEFIDHRHDQSIISLLYTKHNLTSCNYVRPYIQFNTMFHKDGEQLSNGTATWEDGKVV